MNHEEAHRHLFASDKRLAVLIARSHRYNIEPNLNVRPFDALAESIAYQQLSGKAAATIVGRLPLPLLATCTAVAVQPVGVVAPSNVWVGPLKRTW